MRVRRAAGLLTLTVVGSGAAARGADRDRLPFAVGERLSYKVDASGIGGRGTMSVDGPVEVRGTETYLLRFDVRAGVGPIKGKNLTESGLDRLAHGGGHADDRVPTPEAMAVSL